MEADFWQQRWATNQIGFHEAEFHPQLIAHWPSLAVAPGARVFVPLCGKSRDMLWLRAQGFEVVGIELAEIAVRAFFAEQGLQPQVSRVGAHEVFSADGFTIFCGDFFALSRETLGEVAAIYDRAALIALPPAMRRDYAAALTRLVDPGTRMLLITVDYDEATISPPPFAVRGEEVSAVYGSDWRVDELGSVVAQVKGQPGQESVFALHRR